MSGRIPSLSRFARAGLARPRCPHILRPRNIVDSRSRAYSVQYVRFSGSNQSSSGGPKQQGFFDSRTWPMKVGAGIGALIGVYYVSHLETIPETGRRRFMNVSQEAEAEMASIALKEVLQEFRGKILPMNHPLSIHVRKVARKIITASDLGYVRGDEEPSFSIYDDPFAPPSTSSMSPQKEWNVIVVNDKNFINAFASPGVVCVSTGILPVCQDEQGLAAVLGHEIGHVALRHVAEKYSSSTILMSALIFLHLLGIDVFFANSIGSLLYTLPNSRTMEREADVVGLRMMAKACYDPKAAPEVFARLNQIQDRMARNVPQFLSTHPASAERVKYLEQLLPESYDILHSTPECGAMQDAYQRMRQIRIGQDGPELW